MQTPIYKKLIPNYLSHFRIIKSEDENSKLIIKPRVKRSEAWTIEESYVYGRYLK